MISNVTVFCLLGLAMNLIAADGPAWYHFLAGLSLSLAILIIRGWSQQ